MSIDVYDFSESFKALAKQQGNHKQWKTQTHKKNTGGVDSIVLVVVLMSHNLENIKIHQI